MADNTAEMNKRMRDLLIEHIDLRPVPIVEVMSVAPNQRDHMANRHLTMLAAWRRGYLSFDRFPSPRTSVLTVDGRHALAGALANWAEALHRAYDSGLNLLLPNVSREVSEPEELDKLVDL